MNAIRIGLIWFHLVFYQFEFATLNPHVTSTRMLNAKHLTIGPVPFPTILALTRNSSGQIVKSSGIASLTMTWLSQRFRFTFSFLQVNGSTVEARPGFSGMAHYLVNGECDVIPGTVSMDASRLGQMDFVAGFVYSPAALLIKRSDPTANIDSVLRPFQASVWILLIVSILGVIPALYFSINCITSSTQYRTEIEKEYESKKEAYRYSASNSKRGFLLDQISLYVFGILFNQGGHFRCRKNSFRLCAAAWCLSSFILGSAYTSLFVSYMLLPNTHPLVNSIEELATKKGVYPVIDKGNGFDRLMTDAKGGLYKQLGDKLGTNPNFRCLKTRDCVDLVKSGPNVFINYRFVVAQAMREDFHATKTCSLVMAEKKEYAPPPSWAFAKQSPYKEDFSVGLSEMYEVGLLKIWRQWHQLEAAECMREASSGTKTTSRPARLSLKNLTGAFTFLLSGYFIALVTLILERLFFFIQKFKG